MYFSSQLKAVETILKQLNLEQFKSMSVLNYYYS